NLTRSLTDFIVAELTLTTPIVAVSSAVKWTETLPRQTWNKFGLLREESLYIGSPKIIPKNSRFAAKLYIMYNTKKRRGCIGIIPMRQRRH
ncbi:MAG TPA: hypothetical protein PLM89_00150, partial [Anaerolineales bacterium]|nr:hypothetical protein [Anaerolineales bacterium]